MRVIGYYSGLFRGRVEIYIDGLLRNIDRSVRLPFSRRRNIWKKERGEKWYFQEELTRGLSEYCKVNKELRDVGKGRGQWGGGEQGGGEQGGGEQGGGKQGGGEQGGEQGGGE